MRRPPDRRVKGEGGGSVAVAARRHVQSPFSLIAAVHVAPKVSSERASERASRARQARGAKKERKKEDKLCQSVSQRRGEPLCQGAHLRARRRASEQAARKSGQRDVYVDERERVVERGGGESGSERGPTDSRASAGNR